LLLIRYPYPVFFGNPWDQFFISEIDRGEERKMVAYEFYLRDGESGEKLLGILPERRTDPERISQESIMNWAKMAFSNSLDVNKIFFVQIRLENGAGLRLS